MKKIIKLHPSLEKRYRKNILIDKTVWRNIYDLSIKYELLYHNKVKKFLIEAYKDLESEKDSYIVFRTLFSKEETFSFEDKEEMFSFIVNSEKYIYLEEFILITFKFLKNNRHPLLMNNKPVPYYNPIKKENYIGINYFLIFYNEYYRKNQDNIFYYSNSNLKEHGLYYFIKKFNGTIIYRNNKKYDLIAPLNYIRNISVGNIYEYKTINDIKIPAIEDTDEQITEKNIWNYFCSMFSNTEYKTYFPERIKSFILENPLLFIEINKKIENQFKEEYHV